MTVSTQKARTGPYIGDGFSKEFMVDFKFLDITHLNVEVVKQEGKILLKHPQDYQVINNLHKGGKIILLRALAIGEKLFITRNVPFTQQANYVQGDAFPAQSHEQALDKLTMQTQQLQSELNRAVQTQEGEQEEIEIPSAQHRKNKLLGFDSNGQPTAITVCDGLTLQNKFISVKANVGLISNADGISILYGDGLGNYNNAIVVQLGQGLTFDNHAQVQIQNTLIETIRRNANTIENLQGIITNLLQRVADLELTGGAEVTIYIGNGLQYDAQGNLVVKPYGGITVNSDGVSVKLGSGLQLKNDHVSISDELQAIIAGKANASDVTKIDSPALSVGTYAMLANITDRPFLQNELVSGRELATYVLAARSGGGEATVFISEPIYGTWRCLSGYTGSSIPPIYVLGFFKREA